MVIKPGLKAGFNFYLYVKGVIMIKVLFICHGNICRSPMAEFIFKDMVEKLNIKDKFIIESPVYQGSLMDLL